MNKRIYLNEINIYSMNKHIYLNEINIDSWVPVRRIIFLDLRTALACKIVEPRGLCTRVWVNWPTKTRSCYSINKKLYLFLQDWLKPFIVYYIENLHWQSPKNKIKRKRKWSGDYILRSLRVTAYDGEREWLCQCPETGMSIIPISITSAPWPDENCYCKVPGGQRSHWRERVRVANKDTHK